MRKQSPIAFTAFVAMLALPVVSAAARDWSGFYGGAVLGYGAGQDTVSEINGPRAYYPDTKGMMIGGQAGWQRQMERIVAGVEVEGGYLGASGKVTRSGDQDSVKHTIDYGAYGTLSGRVGYVAAPDWLVFGRVGLTLAAADGRSSQSCPEAGACAVTPSSAATRDHAWGVTFGAGVERAFTQRWTGRFEYQYTDFRDELALPDGAGPGWRHDADLHTMKLSINRRF